MQAQSQSITMPLITAILVLMCLLGGCGGQTPLPLPELPRKDWLDEKDKQVPAGAASPIYADDKVLSFADLVYLAIQQSPTLAKSAINLEIQQIALKDARWKALPEMHLLAIVSSNLTQYNRDVPKQKDYGKTKYQISYSGFFNNPVATYFDVKAQNELMSIAIATHKEVIGKCINQIAALLIQIQAKQKSVAVFEGRLETARKTQKYTQTSEQFKTEIWANSDMREDAAREAELQLDTAKMELTVLRSRLKTLVGIDRNHQLLIDVESVIKEIVAFNPDILSWQQCWEESTERYLLAQQVRLQDAGIMLAWAQYVPNVSFVVNESPPNGQAQSRDAETDQFLHVTLNFPILDWGRRYRGTEQARARKRQSQLDEITRRQEYRQRWFTVEEQLTLSRSRLKQREHTEQSALKRLRAVEILYGKGTVALPELSRAQQGLQDAQLGAINARADVMQTILDWMQLSQILQDKFLDSPQAREE